MLKIDTFEVRDRLAQHVHGIIESPRELELAESFLGFDCTLGRPFEPGDRVDWQVLLVMAGPVAEQVNLGNELPEFLTLVEA